MQDPIVKNKKFHTLDPLHDVYIMRPGTFGNPFILGIDGDREDILYKYEAWLRYGTSFRNKEATEARRQEILEKLPSLRGKNLVCCCKPLPCHGDILMNLLEEL